MNVFTLIKFAIIVFSAVESRIQEASNQEQKTVQAVDQASERTTVENLQEQKRVREILEKIAKKYNSINRFQAKIYKFEYDRVFGVEKRGTGTLYFDALGNTRWDIYPSKKVFVSKRITSEGKVYGSDNLEHLTAIWRKDEVVAFRHDDKIIEKMGIIEEKDSDVFEEAAIIKFTFSNRHYFPLYFVNLPSNYLSKLTPEVILKRFQISIDSNSDSYVELKIVPTTRLDSAYFKTMRIIVDKKTAMITAQEMLDPTGNLETAYTFSNFKFENDFPLYADRLYPELRKYRDYKTIQIPSMIPIIVPEGKDKNHDNQPPKK